MDTEQGGGMGCDTVREWMGWEGIKYGIKK